MSVLCKHITPVCLSSKISKATLSSWSISDSITHSYPDIRTPGDTPVTISSWVLKIITTVCYSTRAIIMTLTLHSIHECQMNYNFIFYYRNDFFCGYKQVFMILSVWGETTSSLVHVRCPLQWWFSGRGYRRFPRLRSRNTEIFFESKLFHAWF